MRAVAIPLEDLGRTAVDLLASSDARRYERMARLHARGIATRERIGEDPAHLDELVFRCLRLLGDMERGTEGNSTEIEVALLLAIAYDFGTDAIDGALRLAASLDHPRHAWTRVLGESLLRQRRANVLENWLLDASGQSGWGEVQGQRLFAGSPRSQPKRRRSAAGDVTYGAKDVAFYSRAA